MAEDKWIYRTICINPEGRVVSDNGRRLDKHQFLEVYLAMLGENGFESSVSFTNLRTNEVTIIFKKKIEPSGVN